MNVLLEGVRTEVKAPLEVVDALLGELGNGEAADPVGGSSGGGTAGPPGKGVDLGVVDPGHLGEAGAVEPALESVVIPIKESVELTSNT